MTQQGSSRDQRRARRTRPRALPTHLQAEYVKSNFCRVIHADGAYGGVTGHSLIYMALFSEHNKLPTSARFVVDPVTRTAKPDPTRPSPTWTREVEAEVIMPAEFAK